MKINDHQIINWYWIKMVWASGENTNQNYQILSNNIALGKFNIILNFSSNFLFNIAIEQTRKSYLYKYTKICFKKETRELTCLAYLSYVLSISFAVTKSGSSFHVTQISIHCWHEYANSFETGYKTIKQIPESLSIGTPGTKFRKHSALSRHYEQVLTLL